MKEKLFLNLFAGPPGGLLRGEPWFSPEVLEEQGYPVEQASLIALNRQIGANVCFFAFTGPLEKIPPAAGRIDWLVRQARATGMACGITVDGPFQRLCADHGFAEVIGWFCGEEKRLQAGLQRRAQLAAEEIAAAKRAGAEIILLCEDIAYKQGLYFSPAHFRAFLLPLYRRLKGLAGKAALAGFHSDGNLEPALPQLLSAGYALFSLEPEAMDLTRLRRELPEKAVLLSGIKAQWLLGPVFDEKEAAQIQAYLRSLKSAGGLILASSCGIVDTGALKRLEQIYQLAGNV